MPPVDLIEPNFIFRLILDIHDDLRRLDDGFRCDQALRLERSFNMLLKDLFRIDKLLLRHTRLREHPVQDAACDLGRGIIGLIFRNDLRQLFIDRGDSLIGQIIAEQRAEHLLHIGLILLDSCLNIAL